MEYLKLVEDDSDELYPFLVKELHFKFTGNVFLPIAKFQERTEAEEFIKWKDSGE